MSGLKIRQRHVSLESRFDKALSRTSFNLNTVAQHVWDNAKTKRGAASHGNLAIKIQQALHHVFDDAFYGDRFAHVQLGRGRREWNAIEFFGGVDLEPQKLAEVHELTHILVEVGKQKLLRWIAQQYRHTPFWPEKKKLLLSLYHEIYALIEELSWFELMSDRDFRDLVSGLVSVYDENDPRMLGIGISVGAFRFLTSRLLLRDLVLAVGRTYQEFSGFSESELIRIARVGFPPDLDALLFPE